MHAAGGRVVVVTAKYEPNAAAVPRPTSASTVDAVFGWRYADGKAETLIAEGAADLRGRHTQRRAGRAAPVRDIGRGHDRAAPGGGAARRRARRRCSTRWRSFPACWRRAPGALDRRGDASTAGRAAARMTRRARTSTTARRPRARRASGRAPTSTRRSRRPSRSLPSTVVAPPGSSTSTFNPNASRSRRAASGRGRATSTR